MADRCSITTILISYNCLESLKGSLDALAAQNGIEHEIIVVDNGSADGSIEFLKESGIKSIFSETNLGYGQAANLGASEASGKYLFILNPDTKFGPATLKVLFDFAESRPDIGLISPLLLHPDGSAQISARKLPGRWDFFLGRGSPLFKLGLTDESSAGYIIPENDQPLEAPTVSATALLVSRELFQRIGGFDRRFFLYLEDIDLCRRVGELGLKSVLLCSVTVSHAWRGSSKKRRYFAIYHHHRSVWQYFRKYYPGQWFYNLSLLVALICGFMVSSVLAAVGKRA